MDCVTRSPLDSPGQEGVGATRPWRYPSTFSHRIFGHETSSRGWDRAAGLATCAATSWTPQNSHSHASLELSLSQPLSWILLGATTNISCWIQKVLKMTPRLRCLSKRSWCICPSCASQLSQGTLALVGPMGCRVMLQRAERDLAGKFLRWGRQLAMNQVSCCG